MIIYRNNMQDRRRIARWQINQQSKIRLEGAEAFRNCLIDDINFNGLRVSLTMKFPKDTFLKLTLVLSDEFTLDIEAWVVWHKTMDGVNIYGLYFAKIKDQDKEKIYQFVRNNFPEQINRQWWKGFVEEKGGEIMQNAKFEDRRIFERFAAKVALRFLNLDSGREGQAQTHDISAKGIGMVSNEELAPKTPVEMWLRIPDKGEPLYTRGEVMWSKPAEGNEYRIGVNLEKADLMGLSRVLRTL